MKEATLYNSIRFACLGMALCACILLAFSAESSPSQTAIHQEPSAEMPPPHLGYGFNVAETDYRLLRRIGFDWVKLFGAPGHPQSANVLYRTDGDWTDYTNLAGYGEQMRGLAIVHGEFIDAYEIGNEPNLDSDFGWGTSPDANHYTQLLCTAYSAIKSEDPTALVISAGLAPTGRVSGSWNGHPGHNGLFQDDREFLREMLAAGAGDCLDAVGYHPYGFSADYDADPDVVSGDPRQNCVNGFCFRGLEKIYEIIEQSGYGHHDIWATEMGWLVEPPSHCINDPSFEGRHWQMVSEDRQAENLRGAFEYADANWPWMGAMIVFNLNFNTAPWYSECNQLRFYGVEGRPAEAALTEMEKRPATIGVDFQLSDANLGVVLPSANANQAVQFSFRLSNGGWDSAAVSIEVDQSAELVPTLNVQSFDLHGGNDLFVTATIAAENRPIGAQTGRLTITTDPDLISTPMELQMTILVSDEPSQLFLPIIVKDQ